MRVRLTVDGRLGPEQPSICRPARTFRSSSASSSPRPATISIEVVDRRRSAHARQPPLAGRAGPRVAERAAGRRPFQVRALPGRDRLPGPGLAPPKSRPGSRGRSSVEVVAESQLSRRDLTAYDVVVLCNVAQFSQPEVAALDDYLKQGGGVVIFGGDQVVADNYNRLLYADGKGLLPARLGPSVGDAAKKEAAFAFNPLGYRHPLVAGLPGRVRPGDGRADQATTWQYHKLMLPEGLEGRGRAGVRQRRSRGRRGAAAPRDGDPGGDLGRHGLDDLAAPQELSAGDAADRPPGRGRPACRAEHPGRPAVRPVVSGGRARGARHGDHPRGQSVATKLQAAGGVSQFHFEQTELSGAVPGEDRPAAGARTSFAANPDPAESDSTKLDRAAWPRLPGLELRLPDQLARTDREMPARSAGSGELHRPLLYALLDLALLESFLAWKFGHHELSRPEVASTVIDWLLQKLADRLGVAPPQAGEATIPRIRLRAALAAVASSSSSSWAASALIIWLYRREGKASTAYKCLLAGIRIACVLLAVFMLSEAVLSVERTGLPYLTILVDDSASEQIVDQYDKPEITTALDELAAASRPETDGQAASARTGPETTRLEIAKGLILKDKARLLRELQKQHKVRLYLVSNSARLLAEVDARPTFAPAVEQLRAVEPSAPDPGWATASARCLTELRGAPPSAIVLLTDGQTTEGESLAKAAELAARKGVPLYTIGLGSAEPARDLELTELLVDDVVFVDDAVRFQAKLLARGFQGQKVMVRLKEREPGSRDPEGPREIASTEVDAPADGQPKRVELVYRPKTTGERTYILEVDPRPRELQTENNRIERVGHGPQGEAQGPATSTASRATSSAT